ncbi:uncharacterized protein LDX57_009019 [Aspergillus melleus]|uniref:uncharacterized protein n=1 Tax=Aspergillus melleus TaxID=138277 RepID=UPI001E8E900F|nr:uncharacterized protein LDX57_009019 [Aspergillus melleus]KAH8431361.1 hypothetical protein LDX57_009019 [Aspergillus melleus]
MSPVTISQPARSGDLILAYHSEKRRMLLVTSTGSDQVTSDTSIIRLRQNTEDKTQELPGSGNCTDDEDDYLYEEEQTLRQILDELAWERSGESLSECVVNSHGREVLEHYFVGCCPYCNDVTFFCPGCGGVSREFPELFGSCAVFLSCPVCIGYAIASDEKSGLRALEWEEDNIKHYQRKGKESKLSAGERRQLREHKHEIEDILTEKYETLNERKEDMGLPLDDVDELVEADMDCIFD